jgi:hypothetical protein
MSAAGPAVRRDRGTSSIENSPRHKKWHPRPLARLMTRVLDNGRHAESTMCAPSWIDAASRPP